MPITPTQITPLPEPPSRADPANFAARGDAFLGALPQFQTEINQQATDTFSNVNETFTNAQNAETSRLGAGVFANNASASAAQALLSQNAAKTSETNAKTSELAAANFANAAQETTLGFSTNRPTIRPSLNLDFVNQQVVDRRINVDRNSPKTYFGKRRLLGDENLIKASEEVGNTQLGWAVSQNLTISVDSETSPNGTLTAETFTGGVVNGSRTVAQNVSVTGDHYLSIYAKAGTNNFVQINQLGGIGYANFDILNGIVGDVAVGYGATIEPSTNGFFRISLFGDFTGTTQVRFHLITSNNAVKNESNTLNTSIILWGAMLETAKPNQTAPSAYVPNYTAYPIRQYFSALETAPANTIPVEFDPITSECLGIKPESQRTNLLTYSASSVDVNPVRSTAIDNQSTAPDGTQTAIKVVYNEEDTAGYIAKPAFSFVAGTSYVASYYVKQAGVATKVSMISASTAVIGGVPNASVVFDFADESVVVAGDGVTGGAENIGNGWYRVYCAFTAVNSVLFPMQFARQGVAEAGNNFDGFFAWGFQLEASTLGVPSSYIPTTNAQVTRLADNLTMPVSEFDYNQNEGTLYADFVLPFGVSTAKSHGIVALRDVNNNAFDGYSITAQGAGTTGRVDGIARNVASLSLQTIPYTEFFNNRPIRSCFLFGQNFGQVYTNSEFSAFSDSELFGSQSTITDLLIGFQDTGGSPDYANGYIRTLRYYPKALSALEAQALSQI